MQGLSSPSVLSFLFKYHDLRAIFTESTCSNGLYSLLSLLMPKFLSLASGSCLLYFLTLFQVSLRAAKLSGSILLNQPHVLVGLLSWPCFEFSCSGTWFYLLSSELWFLFMKNSIKKQDLSSRLSLDYPTRVLMVDKTTPEERFFKLPL